MLLEQELSALILNDFQVLLHWIIHCHQRSALTFFSAAGGANFAFYRFIQICGMASWNCS
jgi:hypothetical protein